MARLPGNEGLQIFGNGTTDRKGSVSAIGGMRTGETPLSFAKRARQEANRAWEAASAAVHTDGYPDLLRAAMACELTAGRAVRRLPLGQVKFG